MNLCGPWRVLDFTPKENFVIDPVIWHINKTIPQSNHIKLSRYCTRDPTHVTLSSQRGNIFKNTQKTTDSFVLYCIWDPSFYKSPYPSSIIHNGRNTCIIQLRVSRITEVFTYFLLVNNGTQNSTSWISQEFNSIFIIYKFIEWKS